MNKGKRWSEEENIIIVKSIIHNTELSEIADNIGRSKYAINSQLEKLLLNSGIDIAKKYNEILINSIVDNKNALYEQLNYEENSDKIEPEIYTIMDNIINTIEDLDGLNDEQINCYNIAKNRKNLLITGSGGTGKSTVLKKIIKYFKNNNIHVGVTSSTGISATLINGTTLHSYLKIGIANKPVEELYNNLISRKNKSDYNRLLKLEVLIIDEISMIDNILFSKIAAYLSLIKQIKKPFGGIQIILCGDFHQLACINNDYCFTSKIWTKLKINIVELKIQMRQLNDNKLKYILENVKINNITDEIYEELEKLKYNKIDSDVKPTILYSKNVDVDKINQQEFDKLVKKHNYEVYTFPIQYDNTNNKINNYVKKLENTNIKLCKHLQIMITHNIDIPNQIVNGVRAIIVNINYPNILIKTVNNMLYNISYVKYTNELDKDIEYNYIPIKLAYSITIHKSQGQTLDCLEIDLGESIFGNGMAYTALSRAKTLNSIYLTNLSRNAFKVSNKVLDFYKNINN